MKRIKKINIFVNDAFTATLEKKDHYQIKYVEGIEKRKNFNPLTLNEWSLGIHFLKNEIYSSGNLSKFGFLNNFPEGEILTSIQQNILEQQKESRYFKDFKIDDMFLIALLGQKQIGRLSFKSEEPEFLDYYSEKQEKNNLQEEISLDEILTQDNDFIDLFEKYISHFSLINQKQSSLFLDNTVIAGYQPKISFFPNKNNQLNQKYIIKSFDEKTFPHLALNEFICMQIAQKAGLDVPKHYLSDNQKLFIIERFDFDNRGKRFGVEDFCSIKKVRNEQKYQSNYMSLMKIMSFLNEKELKKMFSYIALSALVKNGDAHLKNFSIIYHNQNDLKLSPIYDIVNTSLYLTKIDKFGREHKDNFAMPLYQGKERDFPTKIELLNFAKNFISKQNANEIIERIESAKREVLLENKQRFENKFFNRFVESFGFSTNDFSQLHTTKGMGLSLLCPQTVKS